MTKTHQWSCIESCGACCKLSPHQRTEALNVLSPEDQDLFLSLVGSDGWCRFYSKAKRECSIYQERPSFCDVKNLSKIFPLAFYDPQDFAIKSCKQHIRYIYGGRSKEMKRFVKNINSLTISK